MKQRLILETVAGILLLLLLSAPLRADESPPTPEAGSLVREDLVFTYTRQATPKSDVAANISVITREEIEKYPVNNAGEVLQYVPGVYVEFNGGSPGSFSAASIQGSEVRHVAVFQDGVPLNLLANPVTDLSFLPVANIERIEVYQGAASSAWGSGLGGVINIITREPDSDETGRRGDFRLIRGHEHRPRTGHGERSGGQSRLPGRHDPRTERRHHAQQQLSPKCRLRQSQLLRGNLEPHRLHLQLR